MICPNCGNKSKLFKKDHAFSEIGKADGDSLFECKQCGTRLTTNAMSGTRVVAEPATSATETPEPEAPPAHLYEVIEDQLRNQANPLRGELRDQFQGHTGSVADFRQLLSPHGLQNLDRIYRSRSLFSMDSSDFDQVRSEMELRTLNGVDLVECPKCGHGSSLHDTDSFGVIGSVVGAEGIIWCFACGSGLEVESTDEPDFRLWTRAPVPALERSNIRARLELDRIGLPGLNAAMLHSESRLANATNDRIAPQPFVLHCWDCSLTASWVLLNVANILRFQDREITPGIGSLIFELLDDPQAASRFLEATARVIFEYSAALAWPSRFESFRDLAMEKIWLYGYPGVPLVAETASSSRVAGQMTEEREAELWRGTLTYVLDALGLRPGEPIPLSSHGRTTYEETLWSDSLRAGMGLMLRGTDSPVPFNPSGQSGGFGHPLPNTPRPHDAPAPPLAGEFSVEKMEAVMTTCAIEIRMGIRKEPLNADHIALFSKCVDVASEVLQSMAKVVPNLIVDKSTAALPLALCERDTAGPALEAATWGLIAASTAISRYDEGQAIADVAELIFPICWEHRSTSMKELIEFRKETWEDEERDSFAMNSLTSILRSAKCLPIDRHPSEQGVGVWSKLLTKGLVELTQGGSPETGGESGSVLETPSDSSRNDTSWTPKDDEELQAFANALPRMIQNDEASIDVEALKASLPRFSDEALFHIERSIRLIPDVKKQTIPMFELVWERRDRASANSRSFQGVEPEPHYDSHHPPALASAGFDSRGIEPILMAVRTQLETWSATHPGDMKYLAILRACVSAANDLLDFLGSIVPEMERLPIEDCFRSLPAALRERDDADAALRIVTWFYLVRATTRWWPSEQSTILEAIQNYFSPPIEESDLARLLHLDSLPTEGISDPLERAEQGKLQLALLLTGTHCLGATERPGPGGVTFWDDAFFSYTDALDESLDSYDHFLDDLSRKRD